MTSTTSGELAIVAVVLLGIALLIFLLLRSRRSVRTWGDVFAGTPVGDGDDELFVPMGLIQAGAPPPLLDAPNLFDADPVEVRAAGGAPTGKDFVAAGLIPGRRCNRTGRLRESCGCVRCKEREKRAG